MGRVNLVNLNLVQVPKAACLNPSVSYYQQFNGFTLGLLGAELFFGFVWVLGVQVLAPISLRRLPEPARRKQLAAFSSVVLARFLLMLFLVYPGTYVALRTSALHTRHTYAYDAHTPHTPPSFASRFI